MGLINLRTLAGYGYGPRTTAASIGAQLHFAHEQMNPPRPQTAVAQSASFGERANTISSWFGAPLLLILVAVPLRIPIPGPFHSVSIFELALPIALLVEASQRRTAGVQTKPLAAFLLLILVAWWTLSVLWSANQLLWWRAMIVLAEDVVVAITFYLWVERRPPSDVWLSWLVLGLLEATCAIAWFYLGRPWVNLNAPANPDEVYSQTLRLGSPFWGPSDYFASMLLLFLPFALSSRIPKRLRYAIALTGGVAVAGTLSRGALVAIALGPIAGILIVRASERPRVSRRRLVLAVAAIAGLLTLLFGAVLTRPDVKQNAFRLFVDSARTSYYQLAVRLFAARPVFGYGYGSWPSLVAGSATKGVHNYYLQVAVESGVVGLVLFAAFLVTLVVHSRRLSNDLALAATTALAAVLLNTAVEASFQGVIFSWLFAMFVGTMLASPTSLVAAEMVR